MESKWRQVMRDGVGAFGYEVWHREQDGKLLVRIYTYDTVVRLSGDPETLGNKIKELKTVLDRLDVLINRDEEPDQETIKRLFGL